MTYRALSEGAGKGSLFVVTIVAARRLSPEAFGLFSVASTLGWMLAVATDGGIQLHLARVVARQPADAGHLLRRWLRVRLWTSAIAMMAVATALAINRPAHADGAALLLFAAVYVVSGLIEFLYYFYRGLGRTDLESSLTIAHRLTLLGCGVFALWWFGSVVWLAIALLVPALATAAAALWFAWRLAGSEPRATRDGDASPAAVGPRGEPGPFAPNAWGEFARDVLPIGTGIVLSALYFRIDLFLVDRWMGAAAAGSYNAVFRLVEALRLFPAAAVAVVLPSLFRAGGQRTILQAAVALTLFGAVVAAAGLLASARLIPLLYGGPYVSAVPAFRILLVSFPLLSLNYALTHQLIGWHGERAYASICGLALAANLALNAVLIPALGISGAAWATLWTELLLAGACAWQLSRLAPQRAECVAVAVAGA